MAKNETRSLNRSLDSGSGDGRYRKVRPDTEVGDSKGHQQVVSDRSTLDPFYNYGYTTTETPNQVNPGRP